MSSTPASDPSMVQMASTAQQASNVVNQVSSRIPEGAKTFMKNAKEKVFDSDKLRSFSIFFGIGETSAFNLVCLPTKLILRLKNNITFFYLNYIVLLFVIMLLSLITFFLNPKTLIILVVLAVAWFFVLRTVTANGIQVLGVTVTRKEASAFMMIISSIVAFYSFQSIFWVSLASSGFLSLLHAWTRDAEQHQMDDRAADGATEMTGNLEPDTEFQ